MHSLKNHIWSVCAAVLCSLTIYSTPSFANDYYRWVDSQGVVHYGSRPPKGVEAEKIKAYGGQSTAPQQTNTQAPAQKNLSKQEATEQKQLIAQRQELCEQEKGRLRTLQTPGRRIKMEQEDGSTRFLTPQEVADQVSESKQFISQSCK